MSFGRRIDLLLAEYAESHRHPLNKCIHWIAVPAIAWSLLAFLWPVPLLVQGVYAPYVNGATLLMVLCVLYYLTLSWSLALGLLFCALAACISFAAYTQWFALPLWPAAATVFVLAWIAQFYGHWREGKKPSFFKDVQFLLVGPAWLLSSVYRRWGWRY